MKKENVWIKFLLNEKLFDEESEIFELPQMTELIEMKSSSIQEKFLIFKYSNNSFRLKFSNLLEIGMIEAEIKDQTGIEDDL
jgi:hypothetical protein